MLFVQPFQSVRNPSLRFLTPFAAHELDTFLAADTEITGRIVKAAKIKPH
jgi:hypothetical protein